MTVRAVRAVFECMEKNQHVEGFTLKFSAVATNEGEYAKFFKYTPWGNLEMGTINAEAAAMFEPGKRYFLDFTPIPV